MLIPKHPNRLAKIRESRGLKQADVARALDLTLSAVSTHESGRRKLGSDTLRRYAELYEVPVLEILIDPDDVADIRHA